MARFDRTTAILKSPTTVLVRAVIPMSAMAVSRQANAVAGKKAETRSELIEAQNVRMQANVVMASHRAARRGAVEVRGGEGVGNRAAED